MRTIAVVTGSRADYGSYVPVLRRIDAEPGLRLSVLVTGAHLASEFGLTVRAIEEHGFPIGARVPTLVTSDAPEGIATSTALGVLGFAQVFAAARPTILLVLGDRYEMLAAVLAAVPFTIPVAHVHGGEITEGAIDDVLRHAITKLSHLHFVATDRYRDRVLALGEEPWRITISGAPGLDNLRLMEPLPSADLEALIGLPLEPAPLLVTFHPVTMEYADTSRQVSELLSALDRIERPIVFTYPGADTAARSVVQAIEAFTKKRADARLLTSLGTRAYFSLMRRAAAMVGNSSSGIIEAASFRLPVVDVGSRQGGRLRPANVIHAESDRQAIAAALERALSPVFRRSLGDLRNPYGDGHAADRIVDVLLTVPLDDRLLRKRAAAAPGSA